MNSESTSHRALIRFSVAFAVANLCTVPVLASKHSAEFLEIATVALYAAEMILLGIWWALGYLSYPRRLLTTAAGLVAIWLYLFLGLSIADRTFALARAANDVNGPFLAGLAIVICMALAVAFLRMIGMKVYNLHELRPGETTFPRRWQFGLFDILVTTTIAALLAALVSRFARTLPEFVTPGQFFQVAGMIGGAFMLTGAVALLAMLRAGNPALRIVVFCLLMSVPYWLFVIFAKYPRDSVNFLTLGMLEAGILLVTLTFVRSRGVRVTWSKSITTPGVRRLAEIPLLPAEDDFHDVPPSPG